MPDNCVFEPTKQRAGARIVSELEDTFRRYLALEEGLPLVLALWTLATHVFACFDAFPYLAITSPTKRCGKTRLGEIIEIFACDALRTAGASAAAIFRTIQARKLADRTVTLIMDEAEILGTRSERAEQLREVLNAGYRAGQEMLRCQRGADDTFEPQGFEVYCPKVFILIGALQDTLADRCIPIAMRRRKPAERVERFFYSQAAQHAKQFRKEMEKWAKANRLRVRRHFRKDLEFLEDREAELWIPLFTICQVVARERVEELKAIALRISGSKHSEESADLGILLLNDIRATFDGAGEERISSSGLLGRLNNIEESPWGSWSNGRGTDARGLARLLRPFGIAPRNLRIDSQILKGYERADFEEAWAMYLPKDSSATPLQTAPEQANHDASDPLRERAVADEKVPEHLQERGV